MSLLFKDGFDYLTVSNIPLKWDNQSGGASLITGVYGKGKAVQNINSTKTLVANVAEGFQGFHLFYGTVAAGTFCSFRDAGSVQVDLRTDATGALFFTRNGTTIGSVGAPSTRLVASTWYWIELRVKIDPTAGIAECKVNDSFVLNSGVTNLNTRNTANSFFNQVNIVVPVGGSAFDTYHCWDTTAGDSYNTYLTQCLIDTSLMTAAGSNAQWTPNASTNVSRINEANQDGDTTYNSSATANQIDSFVPATLLETSGVILDRAINTIDRIDDATPRVINHYMKSGGSVGLSGAISPSATYMNHQSSFPVDPATGVAWTVSGANSSEPGYKEIS